MNGHEMLPLVGKLNRTISTMTQKTATQAIGFDQRPRLQARCWTHSWVVGAEEDARPRTPRTGRSC